MIKKLSTCLERIGVKTKKSIIIQETIILTDIAYLR